MFVLLVFEEGEDGADELREIVNSTMSAES
jgi:hypothetical protein